MPLTSPNISENLFSEHEMVEAPPDEQKTQKLANQTGASLIGTSVPLLTNHLWRIYLVTSRYANNWTNQ